MTKTIAEINEKIGGAMGGIQVLEDDAAIIAQAAVKRTAEDVGMAAALREMSRDFPDAVKSIREIRGCKIPSLLWFKK